MRCKNMEQKILAVIDNKPLLTSDSELQVHLQGCPHCKALYDQLWLENEYLVDAGASFKLPDHLDDKIIAKLPLITRPERKRASWTLPYAVAAGILLIVFILLYPKPRLGKVDSLQGRLQTKTIFSWKDLRAGDSVRKKAVLRTLDNSKAKIVFEEGNYLRLESETSVYLGARVHKDKEHIYRLEYGSIWAKIAPHYSGEFYIETPNALIIRVLGTEFNVQTIPNSDE